MAELRSKDSGGTGSGGDAPHTAAAAGAAAEGVIEACPSSGGPAAHCACARDASRRREPRDRLKCCGLGALRRAANPACGQRSAQATDYPGVARYTLQGQAQRESQQCRTVTGNLGIHMYVGLIWYRQ